ncbi:MAG: HEAT repeat domain-containing protein [Deltaproteobacteria bacterium]|nr:HEAT repeat domain-containing protein [Deltaproteobacteria bacterium]
MADLLSQLLLLVDKGSVEQRCAALLVLGALNLKNAAAAKSAAAALDHANPLVRDFAFRYFEQTEPRDSVSRFLKFLDDGDKEIQERAVRLLTKAGVAATQPLIKGASAASRVWQLNAARVLSSVRNKAALKGLLQMLGGGNDDFNKVLCDLLTPALREMDAREQEQFYGEVEAFAARLDVKQQRPAVVSATRLLGQLGRPEARRWLFKFLGPEHPPILRSHALVALLRCLRDQEIRKDEYARLFPLLEEGEFSEVTRLALELLDFHQLPDDARALLSKLMQSPHAEVQKFALRRMGEVGTPATVRTLVEQLGDADYRRRDAAASSLRKIPEARTALIKELVACDNASKAWSIVELLPAFEGKWRQDTIDALWKRLEKSVGAEERIQTAFLQALKNADEEDLYQRLAHQAARFVKAKKYKEAIGFLAPLKEFAAFKPEQKFQLALAQLKLHAHTLATNRHHPAVEMFSELYRNSAYPLVEALKKEKRLAPEELFALGFGLTERTGEERDLGRDLLEFIAAKFPRNKTGKSAKNKLKLLGS